MFERLTADKVYLNSIRFGIQVNFPHHCGHEKAKEVDDFVKNVFDRLAAYEDSGLSPEEVQELAKAKADGRLFIIPDGYEYAKEFYHVVNAPLWCVEDGWGCEDCPYEEEVGNITDCKFKPYVSRLKPNTVLKAMYVLRNLFLSKEAADQALSTCNTTSESEHRRSGE